MLADCVVCAGSTSDTVASVGNSAWMLVSASFVVLMIPAVAFFYGGMSRQKSTLNMMMMSFGALGVVGVIYVLWGYSMSYSSTDFAGVLASPVTNFGLRGIVSEDGSSYPVGKNGYPEIIDVAFQLAFAAITVALISGALAHRVKYSTWLVFSGVWVTIVFFPLAHMVWGGGLLSGAEDSIASRLFGTTTDGSVRVAKIPPVDFAGGTVVHISAGAAGLVLALIVGRSRDFLTAPQRPHNLPLTMIGTALLWCGWFGFNAGSACAADGNAALAWINTTVAACAAMVAWLAVERVRDGYGTSLGAVSGVVAGLVAITPACGDVTPVMSIILGAVAGVISAYGVGLKFKLKFDDSLDVVGVHLLSGLWGTIGVGLFAKNHAGLVTGGGVDGLRLLILQLVIAGAAMMFTAITTAVIGYALAFTVGWRIDDSDECDGIDIVMHRESAYDMAGSGFR
ncbi:ammonium transporter [Corynebacterium kroppenstedtii]|uniref:ammonium transporter n=1 Tax=Corynebacterium sp. PCR 32 TaxID=3351342 RepID=UPI00309D6743